MRPGLYTRLRAATGRSGLYDRAVPRRRHPRLLLPLVALAATGFTATPAGAAPALEFFRTPSGRIGCLFAERALRCDVLGATNRPPPRPKTCRLDWGHAFELRARGRARLVCHGDTVVNPSARVLAYGRIWRRGGIACTSRRTGLTCSNRQGHGWVLSRARQRRF